MSLNDTPRSDRLHIGIYGKRNSGKSSFINFITGHDTAIVSSEAGTTADPVYKSMEIYGIGPCVLIDTAGFDDEGELGRLRVSKTEAALQKTDIAILLFDIPDTDMKWEADWITKFRKNKVPFLPVLNKADLLKEEKNVEDGIEEKMKLLIEKISQKQPLLISTKLGGEEEKEEIRRAILGLLPEDFDAVSITGELVKENDTVLLVMPQDKQAPKGRLILPQVQTIRELLDKKCTVISTVTEQMEQALFQMKKPPDVIITDSQVFQTVYEKKPKESLLTSFSILFAGYKGDVSYYKESAKAIEKLTEDSKVLIAEGCTHAPLSEDIGREKIPMLLRKKVGEKLEIKIVSGTDFPKDLSGYQLVIHCGACMFNRKYVLERIKQAKEKNVPMSNYGMVIAYLTGIFDKISF